MRTCPITKDEIEPKNPDHFFSSEEVFLKFVEDTDPMETFEPEKREINWTPQERIDPRTGKKFLAAHPAQIYAPEVEEVEEKKTSPNDYFEPQEKECAKCHRKFLRTKPAMKYCEECSDKGGELLE